MLDKVKTCRYPAILSIALAGFVWPISLWAEEPAADAAQAANFSKANLRQKSDEELTAMLAELGQYNPEQRRALITLVMHRMRLNERYQRSIRKSGGSLYGQRIIRRPDGSIVVQRRQVVVRPNYRPSLEGKRVESKSVVSTFGHGFEKRSRARQQFRLTIEATKPAADPADQSNQ